MKSLVSLLLIISVICFGCKKENTSVPKEETLAVPLDSLSKEKIEVDLLKLSPEATKNLESFEDFKNLQDFIQTLKNSNPYYISKYADSVNVLVQNFDENLSEDLKINTILSRISVLSTESGLLMQLTEKKVPDSQNLIDANIRLLTAYNSLIVQLNELSLAIPENIEKELLRERDILRDSILAPEEKK